MLNRGLGSVVCLLVQPLTTFTSIFVNGFMVKIPYELIAMLMHITYVPDTSWEKKDLLWFSPIVCPYSLGIDTYLSSYYILLYSYYRSFIPRRNRFKALPIWTIQKWFH